MKNLIQRFILKKAEEIKKTEKEKQELEARKLKDSWELRSNKKKKIEEVIRKHLSTIGDSLKSSPDHIAKGDEAILNIYSLAGIKSYNSWDGGPRSYIVNCGNDLPVIVLIEKIVIDYSLANERLENWIDQLTDDQLDDTSRISESEIISRYTLWSNRRYTDSSVLGYWNFGIYKTAKFSNVSHEFKPQWGLHIGSFLKLDSPEGKTTREIWEEENTISMEMSALKTRQNELENKRREIDKKYKGITYSN